MAFGFGLGARIEGKAPLGGPSLALVFAGATTLDSRITFTRNSTARYFDSSGVLTSAAINAPRFDYDPVTLLPRGLLIEEQRTNLLLRSEEFDNATWAKNNLTVSANAVTSPDGTADAERIVETTAASAQHLIAQAVAGITANSSITATCYVKFDSSNRTFGLALTDAPSGGSQYAGMRLTQSGTTFATDTGFTNRSFSATPVGNGWYRCSMSVTTSTVTTITVRLFILDSTGGQTYTGDGTGGLYVWGAQLEAGAFATSYIPTTSAQATRVADSAVMTGTNFSSWYNATEGTLYSELVARLGINQGAVVIRNDAGTNSFRIRKNSSNNYVAILRDGTTKDISVTPSPALTEGQTIRIATAVKTNDCAVTGGGQTPSAQATFTLNAMTALDVGGSSAAGESSLNGHIRRIGYWPRRLSNAELQGITT